MEVEKIRKDHVKLSGGPYADLVIVGDQIFLSGLISQDLSSEAFLGGDIEFETDRVLSNMSQLLRMHGSGLDKVVKVDIFLHDFNERDRMNAVYLKHFAPDQLPARICVGGVDLACGCKVEMCATALRGS